MPHSSTQHPIQVPSLQKETDRCVMCGMCSQYCPTYALTQDENESPRGRIALIGAFNRNQLTLNDKLVAHLDHCTFCRACEAYCPSAVRFSTIMDEARTLLTEYRPQPRHEQQIQRVLSKPKQIQRLGKWLERYQRWGLQRLMRATGLLSLTGLANSESILPSIPHIQAQPEYSPPSDLYVKKRGDIALFTGCVSSIVDREALDASRRLLNLLGYGVYTPSGQTCCGALFQHSGQPGKAAELAQTNLAVFSSLDIDSIVHTSTGCTSFLKEYHQVAALNGGKQNATKLFADKVQDINQFLDNIEWPSHLTIHPLSKRVAVHEPCSARNVLHVADKSYRLLELIPQIECIALPDNAVCCGAAGSQLLTPSTFGQRLRQNKLDVFSELNKISKIETGHDLDTLVTTNIGCALHLAAGLREQGKTVEVLHPVTLLFRQVLQQNEEKGPCISGRASAKVIT